MQTVSSSLTILPRPALKQEMVAPAGHMLLELMGETTVTFSQAGAGSGTRLNQAPGGGFRRWDIKTQRQQHLATQKGLPTRELHMESACRALEHADARALLQKSWRDRSGGVW